MTQPTIYNRDPKAFFEDKDNTLSLSWSFIVFNVIISLIAGAVAGWWALTEFLPKMSIDNQRGQWTVGTGLTVGRRQAVGQGTVGNIVTLVPVGTTINNLLRTESIGTGVVVTSDGWVAAVVADGYKGKKVVAVVNNRVVVAVEEVRSGSGLLAMIRLPLDDMAVVSFRTEPIVAGEDLLVVDRLGSSAVLASQYDQPVMAVVEATGRLVNGRLEIMPYSLRQFGFDNGQLVVDSNGQLVGLTNGESNGQTTVIPANVLEEAIKGVVK
ncbi:MAG: hypothetical protein V1707_00560 [bacterium]